MRETFLYHQSINCGIVFMMVLMLFITVVMLDVVIMDYEDTTVLHDD